jgi:HemY protein
MIKALFILLLLFVSVWLGIQMHGDAGYVLVVIRHWTLESTLWVALFGLFILFSVFHLLLLSYRKAVYLPTSWQDWRLKHRAERAQNKTTQGLIEFSEGDWKAAKTHLIQALPHTETPLINYLIAARAAQELGETKQRDNYLREAQQSTPNAKIAVELTQAQLQLAHKQWEQALATLRHLHDLSPKHPYILKRLAHLYEAIEDWSHLIDLLPYLSRYHALTEKKLSNLTYRAYLGDIQLQITQSNWQALDMRITQLPKALKYNPALMTCYSQALMKQDKNIQAELCLRRTLQKNLDASLLKIYSQLPACTVRLSVIESLLKHHTHSSELHRCLGELYAEQQLLGKAQIHLEQSLKLKPSPEAYHALGELFESLKDNAQAFKAYKQGLEKMLTAQQ